MRVALRFAYDGRFSGYARQPEGGTVEDHMLRALAKEGLVARSWRAGSRTDRGVCAAMNVAVCTLDRRHLKGIVPATQQHLPPGIWITGATEVPDDFDPRRAKWRQYAYHAPKAGEDLEVIRAACAAFVGEHNMTAFARLDGRDPIRRVMSFEVEERDEWWVFHVRGQAFLWNQVRRMVAAAIAVGRARATVQDILVALASGEAHATFGLASPEGLLLEEICYDLTWDPAAGPVMERQLHGPAQQARVLDALMTRLISSA